MDTQNTHDPKGKVFLKLPQGVTGEARFSPCQRYRHSLIRRWGEGSAVLFIGHNPSVADATRSDPTCDRELKFAQSWGHSEYRKGNVLDWRATHPKDIPQDLHTARSPHNLDALTTMAQGCSTIIMACGVIAKPFLPAFEETVETLQKTGIPLLCLKRTKQGFPGHPLYLSKTTKPFPFLTDHQP